MEAPSVKKQYEFVVSRIKEALEQNIFSVGLHPALLTSCLHPTCHTLYGKTISRTCFTRSLDVFHPVSEVCLVGDTVMKGRVPHTRYTLKLCLPGRPIL